MATEKQVAEAKQEARNIAKDFTADADEKHLGFVTLYTWAYEPDGISDPIGDFTEAQLGEIFDAGVAVLA